METTALAFTPSPTMLACHCDPLHRVCRTRGREYREVVKLTEVRGPSPRPDAPFPRAGLEIMQ
jgi:hypothetical protein